MGSYWSPSANFTNVIFSNGLMDPIRTFSPQNNITGITVIDIPYSGHCEDINAPVASEPLSITNARYSEGSEIAQWIQKWIGIKE